VREEPFRLVYECQGHDCYLAGASFSMFRDAGVLNV